MKQTIEAEVDEKGNIRPKEPITLPPGARGLITVLGEPASEKALLNEASLGARLEPSRGKRGVGGLGAGVVVLIRFPFSDLSLSKVRRPLSSQLPAVRTGSSARSPTVLSL